MFRKNTEVLRFNLIYPVFRSPESAPRTAGEYVFRSQPTWLKARVLVGESAVQLDCSRRQSLPSCRRNAIRYDTVTIRYVYEYNLYFIS